ncbi:MAG TPA: mannose-1-phosphate guanylyltransferase/mannose-6-phosphate isomerase [Xanthobacteraceae bacterium]|jgi:mannose-1-phosphate guanylyltransferase/mannose-6-phosphate isomerase|nr:mannose-1-phosphate guanylyltransferase/mannose-6-phosphate isomerase [Xanthobacteraceae bacterium]
MPDLITPIIMCGGAGTRLWPASREGRPKQFLRLFGPNSTFQETIRRVSDPELFAPPIVITNSQYRFLVAEQLAEIDAKADILLEPSRRNSGPAIAAGAALARRRGDPVLLALAADHVIADAAAFSAACRRALAAAQSGRIVTFGIKPDRPATEYGYIRPGELLDPGVFAVEAFVEKPEFAAAERYVAEGFLWNSGNFVFRASVFLDEYRRFEPETVAAIDEAVDAAGTDLGFVILDGAAFERARAESVDYAVMERTGRAAVVPVDYAWSDVGSWHAVWDLSSKDSAGNAARGEVVFVDAAGSLVASDKALVALFGVEDLVVVAAEDAVLVARRGDTHGMKRLVDELKRVAPKVTEEHLRVHRPWGSYQSLDQGSRYQVKRIVVKPGGRLSLQLHRHRAEHWVVVRGTACVTVGEKVQMLHENESIYIPIDTQHRLENPGKIDLELIEVQTGSYLGEDDIVRLQDDYRRS